MAKAPIPSVKFERELAPGSIKGAMQTAEASEKSGLWLVPVGAIRRLDGFNVRIATPDYEAHIESIAQSIIVNGFYPNKPLAGYVAKEESENVVYITDGYSRLSAAEIAIERGAEIEKLPVILKPATENMVDLTVALVQDNEGRPLTPFERAIVVKRLVGFNVEVPEIAKRLGVTERYISDLQVLAGAPAKVRGLVIAGKVSPTEAIKQLRKNPEKAGEKLSVAVEKAAAEGKSRASAKHIDDGADAGDDDELPNNITVTKTVKKSRQVEKLSYRLKGGEKVRKGYLESILSVDNGSWWREAEELDDAAEGDIVITKTITITLTVEQEAPETDAGAALSDDEINSSLEDGDETGDGEGAGDADAAAAGEGDQGASADL